MAVIRRAAWWPAVATLVVTTAALGAALLIPYLFSDPNGVDPYVARISAVALLLTAASLTLRRLQGSRAVFIAVLAVTGTFSLLSAGPQILSAVFGEHAPGFVAQVLWASVAQLVVTAALTVLALRVVPSEFRPLLRLRRFGPAALLATVCGSLLLIAIGLAIPAAPLGRLAVQPVQLGRDLPWVWPANALQGLSQELQFRGLLMGSLERVLGRNTANLAQACFFGLSHLAVSYEGPVAPFVPVTIVVGLALGWIVQRTGSLWPAIVIHAVADIAIAVAVVPGLYGF